MKKLIKTPTNRLQFVTSNGITLTVYSYPREIKSSTRVDAKVIGIDWETVYTQIYIGIDTDGSSLMCPSLVHHPIDFNDENWNYWQREELNKNLRAIHAFEDKDRLLQVVNQSRDFGLSKWCAA